jgi:hypothetical protein
MNLSRQLVRESEWMRVYRLESNHLHYESKFLTDHLQIDLEDLKRRWSTLTAEDKRDFVRAYSAIKAKSTRDFEILRFLMKVGTSETWGWLANSLTDLPEKDLVLNFLLERLKNDDGYFPDYAQALETLGDSKATDVLAEKFAMLRQRVTSLSTETGQLTSDAFFDCVSYLHCCRALVKLAAFGEAREALNAMQTFPDQRVRSMAKRLSVST